MSLSEVALSPTRATSTPMTPRVPAPTTAAEAVRGVTGAPGRIGALDAMRGSIIVLMAIDHARGFIAKNHPAEWWGRPLPDYGPDAVAFLTRLVTHLCAPGFVFLMGTAMVLFAVSRAQAGWPHARIQRYFVTRGLALILLGQVLENGAVIFGLVLPRALPVDYGVVPPGADATLPFFVFPVLYGLGSVMVLGAFLYRLRPLALWTVAAGVVLVMAAVVPDASQVNVQYHPILRLLIIPGQTGYWFIVYPAVAWLPPALLGLAFGRWMLDDRRRAFVRLALVGAIFLTVFTMLRLAGGFGNFDVPRPGWIGFLNVTKYPPSLTFLLMTLGVDFLLLAAIERARIAERGWSGPLLVFGAVPFFFYVTHMWLYAAIGRFFPEGMSIPLMYPFWLLGLVLLYLPCRWYGAFKRCKPVDSFWRML